MRNGGCLESVESYWSDICYSKSFDFWGEKCDRLLFDEIYKVTPHVFEYYQVVMLCYSPGYGVFPLIQTRSIVEESDLQWQIHYGSFSHANKTVKYCTQDILVHVKIILSKLQLHVQQAYASIWCSVGGFIYCALPYRVLDILAIEMFDGCPDTWTEPPILPLVGEIQVWHATRYCIDWPSAFNISQACLSQVKLTRRTMWDKCLNQIHIYQAQETK